MRRATLARGEKQLDNFSIAHNYFGFYEGAIWASLQIEDWDEVDRYANTLENFSDAEILPRNEFYIARGRVLAACGRGKRDDQTIAELRRLKNQAESLGFRFTRSVLETALA